MAYMTDIQLWIENRKTELREQIDEAVEAHNSYEVDKLVARYCELGNFFVACRHCGLLKEVTEW